MAEYDVLRIAITKLQETNIKLFEKLLRASDGNTKERVRQEISKNETMILDYKFRLEHGTN